MLNRKRDKDMKKLNKYHWLTIGSIIVFCLLYLSNCKREKKDINEYSKIYPLKVVDNEIRNGDDVLYRFIPVDGGVMDFSYKSTRTQSDATNGWQDTVDVYNSKRIEIPSMLIGETPVTVNLWVYVMEGKVPTENSAYRFQTVYVSDKTKDEWRTFISRLNQLTGSEFGLPTSYEWEYAARGGQKSKNYKYAGSDDVNEVAQYKGNTRSERFLLGKEKAPNELGLYDMSGGVHELTTTPVSDIETFLKMFSNESMDNNCISRGGSYNSSAEECETRYVMKGYTVRTGARLILKY